MTPRPGGPLGPIVLVSVNPLQFRLNVASDAAQGLPLMVDDASMAAFAVSKIHELLGLPAPDWGAGLTAEKREELTQLVRKVLRERRLIG